MYRTIISSDYRDYTDFQFFRYSIQLTVGGGGGGGCNEGTNLIKQSKANCADIV